MGTVTKQHHRITFWMWNGCTSRRCSKKPKGSSRVHTAPPPDWAFTPPPSGRAWKSWGLSDRTKYPFRGISPSRPWHMMASHHMSWVFRALQLFSNRITPTYLSVLMWFFKIRVLSRLLAFVMHCILIKYNVSFVRIESGSWTSVVIFRSEKMSSYIFILMTE